MFAGPGLAQQLAHATLVLECGKDKQLAGDVAVLALLSQFVSNIQ
jgi:hypothetical protein